MKWVLYTMMRRQSERLPDKMLKKIWTPMGYVSLAEWAVENLRVISEALGLDYFFGIAPHEFPELAEHPNAIQRSYESVEADSNVVAINHDIPPRLDKYNWAVFVSACCPLLTAGTVKKFIDGIACVPFSATHGIQAAFEDNGFVYTGQEQIFPVESEGIRLNTKTNASFYTPCHALCAMPAQGLGRSPIKIKGYVSVGRRTSEFLDVDTADDLETVAAVSAWKYRGHKPVE